MREVKDHPIMRALSIKQPFAELIARGDKTKELRSRNTSHRGPLLVVASKAPDRGALTAAAIDPSTLVYGHAVCVVDLVDVEETDDGYAYVLARPRRVDPVPVTGSLAFYNVDDGLVRVNGASAQLPAPPPPAPPARVSSPRLAQKTEAPFPALDAPEWTSAHARYWAEELSRQGPLDEVAGLSRALGDARVDLNPHQIDAALFALASPLAKGALLADEVGLGKTIEAGLVLAQKWAERKRRILLAVPATLRKQWQNELKEKFYLPSLILDTPTVRRLEKERGGDPFDAGTQIVIASHDLVARLSDRIARVPWDLAVVDEAHRLRGLATESKRALAILGAIEGAEKRVLLTATPLQNRLDELWALVQFVDPQLFGPKETFVLQYAKTREDREGAFDELRERLRPVVKRTLRNDVREFIRYTNRIAHTYDFEPSEAEQRLYGVVSEYLKEKDLAALPKGQRQLMVMILRKLLASSSRAIGTTLGKLESRLRGTLPKEASEPLAILADDYETAEDDAEESGTEDIASNDLAEGAAPEAKAVAAEADKLASFVALAGSIGRDAKASALVQALPDIFRETVDKGGARKVVIFTESRQTQAVLQEILEAEGYEGRLLLMNGENKDPISRKAYVSWKERHKQNLAQVASGNAQADMKAAIVEAFREEGEILLATESAAEGVNLQFCSVIINYDLPWNPQRIEQRIGRCHRYGQKNDVLVVNFANSKNAADKRVLELLDQKFGLFNGVFGASDAVLGSIQDGFNLANDITRILQETRTTDEIHAAFDALQSRLAEHITRAKDAAKQKVLDHFDADVARTLQVTHDEARKNLDAGQRMLLGLAEVGLRGKIELEDASFRVLEGIHAGEYHLDWRRAEEGGIVHFRPSHPLAEGLVHETLAGPAFSGELSVAYQPSVAALQALRGRPLNLAVERFSISTLGRQEDHVVVAAEVDGVPMEPEVARKIFEVPGSFVESAAAEAVPASLKKVLDSRCMALGAEAEARAAMYYERGVRQIDARLDDVRTSVQLEIDAIGAQIKAVQQQREKAQTLDERLACEAEQKRLQRERRRLEQERFSKQDELDEERNRLVDALKDKKDDRKTERRAAFWARVRVCG